LAADQLQHALRTKAEHAGRGADGADIDRAGNGCHGNRLSRIEEFEFRVEPFGGEIALVLRQIDRGRARRFEQPDGDRLGRLHRHGRFGQKGPRQKCQTNQLFQGHKDFLSRATAL
jgi:hypothetical protein